MMHAFWEYWDGFPRPCDEMNIYTFRRDLAQFILKFQFYDRMLRSNPWEEWRPYYNDLVAEFLNYSGPDGEDGWQLLAEVFDSGDHFRADIWNLLYHIADTDPPMLVSGKLHLIPPPLRPYFEGYIDPVHEAEPSTWRDDLAVYSALASEDLRLMDFASRQYHRLLVFSRSYIARPSESDMRLAEPFRTHVREADRQALVDFVNTLEDMSCNTQCEELWNAAPGFWRGYSYENLIRAQLYTDEIGIDTGIELEEANWNAVHQALEVLPACGETSVDDARNLIGSLGGITEIQRAALLQVLMVRERERGPCYPWAYMDGNSSQEVLGIEDGRYAKDNHRSYLDTLNSEMACSGTVLYKTRPLDLSKGPCQP